MLYEIVKRELGVRAEQRLRAGNYGKSTEAGHGKNPVDSEASSAGCYRVLPLPSGRHLGVGAVASRCRGCHHVPGF